MAKKQEKEKIDIFGMNWQDEFNDYFYFIKGGVDVVSGCFRNGGYGVSSVSVVTILEEANDRLDKMRDLMDRVNLSIREVDKDTRREVNPLNP
jgi:hypothetical protein